MMVSAFQTEAHEFGMPLSEDQLKQVNEVRQKYGRSLLESSPGLIFFEYGKNKSGYWDADDFHKQVEGMMDMAEALHPEWQMVFEVDHSAGHSKKRVGGLIVSSMNVRPGGKQPPMREGVGAHETEGSVLREGDVGPTPMVVAGVDKRLKVGDTQVFQFKAGCHRHPNHLSAPNGQTKGMTQILWERGLFRPGMKAEEMTLRLAACTDFATEQTLLQKACVDRGHILTMSPKGHCEVAGRGIEFSWGRSKADFRLHNDCVGKHLLQNIKNSIGARNLPIHRLRKFARKARDYKRAFQGKGAADTSHAMIEKIVKTSKAHRCALDFDYKFCTESDE
jgi:hypothetical protein